MTWIPVAVGGVVVISYILRAVRKRRTIRRHFWGLIYAVIHARYQKAVRDELVYAQARLMNYALTDMAGKNASFLMPDPEIDVPLYGEADGE